MSTALDRALSILELLASQPAGLSLSLIADALDIPRSACHRVLVDLISRGYVRQAHAQGDYMMTTKLASLGLCFLSSVGLVDLAQPVLDGLAERTGELVRLALVDGDRLTWVAKAQGVRKGLRYDPDMGMDAQLSCTSAGHAWMLTMSDERAIALVSAQGFGSPKDFGPNAPTTIKALLGYLHAARVRGYAMIDEVFAPGMTAISAPVQRPGRETLGVISIAGPKSRWTKQRMQSMAPELLQAAAALTVGSNASGLYKLPPLGKA
jgi:DNA-binding IclR family transcriptional regulator